MDHAGAALSLRPLTVGELLDSAVSLLRAHGRVLLSVAVILAATEQALLVPLRGLVTTPGDFFPDPDAWGAFWLVLCLGAATEATIIAVLDGFTARAAGAAVLGDRLPARRLLNPRGGRPGTVIVIAAAAGITVFTTALVGPLWTVGYALVGLAVPAAIMGGSGPVRAVGRGAVLACRAGLRAVWVRLLGYFAWLTVRIALALGGLAILEQVGPDHERWAALLAVVVWVVINGVAYPTLACLDAMLYLEVRTRTEGLDITLARARRNGPVTASLLRARP